MKLTTYLVDGRPTVGIGLSGDVVAPLAALWIQDDGAEPLRDMLEVIERWDHSSPPNLSLDGTQIEDTVTAEELDAEQRWLPPVPRPTKIMGVALNNKALYDLASFAPSHPTIFCYPPSALTGHRQPIELRSDYGLTHPEPELGVVIGRRAKRIAVDEALDYVFGYTIVDDVTSPSMKSGDTVVIPRSASASLGEAGTDQAQAAPPGFEHGDMQLTYHARSKGTDTFAPCGPWIVTKDEIPDPDRLAVTLTIDGELCMEDNTGNLMYSVAEVVSFASAYFTLEPGDIVHIGTAGRGKYRLRDIDYQHRLGGVRTIEIESVGSLINPIARVD